MGTKTARPVSHSSALLVSNLQFAAYALTTYHQLSKEGSDVLLGPIHDYIYLREWRFGPFGLIGRLYVVKN